MLLRYRFKNFFSFAEETEVNLAVGRHVPDSDSVVMSGTGMSRVSKVMAIMGPNACGKTNLLKPLPFLQWFIKYSFQAPADQNIPLQPHMLYQDDSSIFEVEFEFDGALWKYQLQANAERVIWEALYRKAIRFSYVFTRDWQGLNKRYEIKQQGFGLGKKEAENVRQNASLISTAAQYGVELAMRFQELSLQTNVDYTGRIKSPFEMASGAASFYKDHPNLRKQMTRLLKGWDLGLDAVEIRQFTVPEKPDEKIDYMVGMHLNTKGEFGLAFHQESSGTQGAVMLLQKILPVLQKGGVAAIDEFEADLHPHMLEPILNLFLNPSTNPHDAQMIFTCHAAEILNHLHKSQVTMVEKDDEHISRAWRLDQVAGIRADDNLYAKYMAGAYSAVPRV
jgi:AAA15 family ATPase/GTPase